MVTDVFRSMFYKTLALLDGDGVSPADRFAGEEALIAFIRVLATDERCVTDLLAYVARAVQRRRPHCRRAVVAAAALRAIREHDRAFATARRILAWAAAAGDDGTVAYVLEFHLCSHLRRCDVDPALIERGYRNASRTCSAICYVASLVKCPTKDEVWLRCFVQRHLNTLASFETRLFDRDLELLRRFAESTVQPESGSPNAS